MQVFWFVLMVVFLIAEAACPVHLVSIWFAVGALAATVAALLSGALWLQITLFLGISGVLLALLWPFTKKMFKPSLVKTNVDAVLDSTGRVITAIDNVEARGQVKLGAMEWTARSTSGQPIPSGALVRVDRIEGVKVFVSVVEEEVCQN